MWGCLISKADCFSLDYPLALISILLREIYDDRIQIYILAQLGICYECYTDSMRNRFVSCRRGTSRIRRNIRGPRERYLQIHGRYFSDSQHTFSGSDQMGFTFSERLLQFHSLHEDRQRSHELTMPSTVFCQGRRKHRLN